MTTEIQRYHMENVREYLGRLLALKADLDQIAQEVANDQVREHLEIVRDTQIVMLREARRALDEALAILDQTAVRERECWWERNLFDETCPKHGGSVMDCETHPGIGIRAAITATQEPDTTTQEPNP